MHTLYFVLPLLAHGGIHSNVTPIEKFVSGIGFFVISLALMSLIFKRYDDPPQQKKRPRQQQPEAIQETPSNQPDPG